MTAGTDMTPLIEQIARAIIMGSAGERAANHAQEFVTANWEDAKRSAQAILPLIEAAVLAERERCAGVAEQPIFFDYVRLTTPDGPFEPGSPYDRGRQVEAERIAAAIRSKPDA